MGKVIDLTGQRFGMWTVIDRAYARKEPAGGSAIYWNCVCDCGTKKAIQGRSLRDGTSTNCGCKKATDASIRKTIHGKHNERLYGIWQGIKARCNNPNSKAYCHYGGRGVRMCKEWEDDYLAFREWAFSHGYEQGLSIDRIDVNGNYEPSNCRWADYKVQANNRTNNHYVEIDGVTKIISQWSEETGVSQQTISSRLRSNNFTKQDAIFYNQNASKSIYTLDNESHSIAEWSRITGINYSTLRSRLRNGMTIEDAINTPIGVPDHIKKYEIDGVSHTLPEWSEIYGVKLVNIYGRLRKGWSVKDAITSNFDARKINRKEAV